MQKEVVVRCRQAGKAVIVASHLLQSMIEYPTPTRAEARPPVLAHLLSLMLLFAVPYPPFTGAVTLKRHTPQLAQPRRRKGCHALCM